MMEEEDINEWLHDDVHVRFEKMVEVVKKAVEALGLEFTYRSMATMKDKYFMKETFPGMCFRCGEKFHGPGCRKEVNCRECGSGDHNGRVCLKTKRMCIQCGVYGHYKTTCRD